MCALPGILVSKFIESVSVEQIQPAGIDLTLERVFVFCGRGAIRRSGVELPHCEEVEPRGGIYVLEPGVYKIRFREVVSIPEDCVGIAFPRSSLLRMGASINLAVWDPGYVGRGEAMLLVLNPNGIEIEVGARVAQLVLIKLVEKPHKLYRGRYYGENVGEEGASSLPR
ncbi:MAG: deoxyuridine 5'-triphosphate nucleotidohydrolase [Thermoprotei archaeon]|nr:MAG: deoxyuridine 5'-triphosphate nucleotidohydrolase [Thermoprotei archaeon]